MFRRVCDVVVQRLTCGVIGEVVICSLCPGGEGADGEE